MKTKVLLQFTFTILIVLLVSSCTPKKPADGNDNSQKLPVYSLKPGTASGDSLVPLAKSLFHIEGELKRRDDRMVYEKDNKVLEVNSKTGALWYADRNKMWNADLNPQLPDEKRALELASSFINQNKLLPAADKIISSSFSGYGSTRAAIYNTDTKKKDQKTLDIQVNYRSKVIANKELNLPEYPIVGGGNEIKLTFGDKEELIGYSGVQREITAIDKLYPVIAQSRADSLFKTMTQGLKDVQYKSEIAYYSASPSIEQGYLYPVYVYRATFAGDGKRIPMRIITLPATTFNWSEVANKTREIQKRDPKLGPERRSTIPEGQEEKGDTSNFKSPLYQYSFSSKPGGSFIGKSLPQTSSWKECGTSWIGESQGLGGSKNNAKGFVDGLSAAGWSRNFNWGDENAWESDWKANDDGYVDAADFVFYTGHAWLDGWVLNPPDGSNITSGEVGASPETPGDLWGQQDLEWVVVAACGPLQDDILAAGGGDVLDRWKGAFDGLHLLLGYGAVTYDNEEEGKKLTQYCKDGNTIIDAWFRAAQEIQPSDNGYDAPDGPTIWVGVMYVYRSGTTSPSNDHIWERGSVAPDPHSPNIYVAMWTTT